MPKLSKPRHESVEQALFKGTSADKAYAEAGFKPSRFNAARFAKKEHILQRVTELQAAAAEKAEVNINHNYAIMTEEEVLFEIASIHQELRAIKASKGKVQH